MLLARWLPAPRRAPAPDSRHVRLRVGLVADDLTRACLQPECQTFELTPANHNALLKRERPDLVFVESAWSGLRDTWKYRIAAYPDHPERNNRALAALLAQARELGIPSVFWNKEDGVHFERFIASARLTDVVLTVDASCIPRYQMALGAQARVAALPFAVQPRFHQFSGIDPQRRGACFVGSYGTHVHDGRRDRQSQLLPAAAAALGLTVHDRNSDRRGGHYRYPAWPGLHVKPKVPYARTAAIYKSHLVCLNVNTIEDSPTMFSRRLVEILGCGGMAVSTPALAIGRLFPGLCHVVDSAEAAAELFARLARDGYSAGDHEMMNAAAVNVAAHHTWSQRLDAVLDMVGRRATPA